MGRGLLRDSRRRSRARVRQPSAGGGRAAVGDRTVGRHRGDRSSRRARPDHGRMAPPPPSSVCSISTSGALRSWPHRRWADRARPGATPRGSSTRAARRAGRRARCSPTATCWPRSGSPTQRRLIADDDVYLLPFPLCHIAGYNVIHHHRAARPVVVVPRFDARAVRGDGRPSRITAASLAATMLHSLLDLLDEDPELRPRWEPAPIAYGAAPMPVPLLRRGHERRSVSSSPRATG